MVQALLVDDHRIMREGLRSLLETRGIHVIGEAGDGRTAVEMATELHPDVVVMDITIPLLNGIDATALIMNNVPTTKVIALSMHSDARVVDQMLKAGALGYVLKDSVVDDLLTAVHTVLDGQPYFSPRIAQIVLNGYLNPEQKTETSTPQLLSSREREVLQLFAEGHSTKEIAQALFVSIKTIEKHRQNIMDKLQFHSIAEMTKYAIREGLTTL